MSYKSTTRLTRQEAIKRYADIKSAIERRKWEAEATALSDGDLGDALDGLCEESAKIHRTTCFDNFVIVDSFDD